jgi:hypothetical protein
MQIPIILAHGALGWWDELIFLGIIVIFIGMMIVSWFRSRDMEFEQNDLLPQEPRSSRADDDRPAQESDERFVID